MVLPRGPDDADVGASESEPWAGDSGLRVSDEGASGIGGGARSFGQTGEVLSRKNRLQVFGIDCTGPFGDGIIFKGGEWAPGGEYVQRLRVKNVSPKLKKLKYRLPTTKYFSLAYPEVITLSPGTMQEVDVVFRPKASEVYDDVILFKVLDGPNAGGFNVPVRALLPTLQVGIPVGLDFGYCQADDVSERVFFVQNTGEVAAPFQWTVPPPFTMSPAEGTVAVGESQAVTCSVRPTDASVFVSQAALTVGQGVNAIKPKPLLDMKVSCIGKYCYVVPSEDELDFGDQTIVAVGGGAGGDARGGCPRKDFTLRNQSVVPAAFTIHRLEDDRDPVFSVHPSEGVIPPEDEVVVTVTYSPVSAGTFSRDHYEVVTVGGNKVTVGIQGRAVGCSVRLEKKEDPFARGCGVPDSVNFREVKVGVTTTRVINLYNEASTPCRFCFVIQNVGLGRCSPEELDELLATQGMSDLFAKVGPQGTLPIQRCRIAKPLTRSGEATRVQTAIAAEFFVDPTDPILNGVCLDRFNVDLGFARTGGHETVTLTNNTDTAVHVVWNLRSSDEGEGDQGTTGLQVTPLEADVPEGASLSFRVEVSPTKGNCYFAEEAEAFVSPLNQMTFRTVKDATQQPPWCLPLRVLGHTFVGEQFLAKASLSTQHTGQKMCFPACHVGDTVYQTIRLSNQGNIPACFSFQPDPSGVFDIKPSTGLVPAGDFQLCLVRFTPPGPGGCHHRLECVLNNDPGSTQQVDLFGQGALPAIEATCGGWDEAAAAAWGGDDGSRSSSLATLAQDERSVVYMRPTCVGIVSSGVIKVRSILGETPLLTDCRQLGEAMPAVVNHGACMTVLGQGERGAVMFHPESLAFSVRLVNTPESKPLVLENCSECDVKYKLFYIANNEPPLRQSSKDYTGSSDGGSIAGSDGGGAASDRELRPVPKENDMAEQGRKARASAARLEEAGVQGVAGGGEDTNGVLSGIMPLRCRVSGRASFPTVVFRDVRMTAAGGGGVRGASPRNLWSALSLSTINAMLSKPLTEEEIMFNQVSIKEGRHFWLDLKGTTVPPQFPMLYVPTGLRRQYILEPVAVGTPLNETPLQTTELLNVGEAAVSFKVDSNGIKRANNSQGHGMPVFRLEEKTGTIPGGGSTFLRWRFLPLEAKEYVLRVTVRTTEHHDDPPCERFEDRPEEKSLEITLRGVGYDPRTRDPHSEVLPAVDLGLVHPARQLEVLPGQPCLLGAERLRLGRIPQGAILSRVISVRNCLTTSATRSRKPKSRLESRMEEERQARARAPEPRVPVVSRPTAARTQHMAEIAKTLSTRHSCSDDHGRILCPTYPVSTVNAPVPSVLAEALLKGARGASGDGIRGDDAAMQAAAWEREGSGGSSRNHPSRGSSKDWAAFGSAGKENGEPAPQKGEHQQQLTLLKRASKDHPLATEVASRVLKRLLEDVVASHEVRECFKTLPARPRVPTFAEVSDVPPLPDRVAAALAPHLQASPPPPPVLTAAAAAVNASQNSVRRSNWIADDRGENSTLGVHTAVNGSTPLRKEELLAALRAVGVGVKAHNVKRKGGKGGANSRKKDPLAAGLVAAVQGRPGLVVSLQAVIAELDHSTVVRLEAWVEQRNLEAETQALASRTQTATTVASAYPAPMADDANTGDVASKTADSAGREEMLGHAPPPAAMSAHATTIQAQARRLQAVRATEERTRQRLLQLADKACQDHDTQRIVAAALEGTFFNLIQDAFHGEFKLSKRPTRYAVRRLNSHQTKPGMAA
eukprot:g4092.t1